MGLAHGVGPDAVNLRETYVLSTPYAFQVGVAGMGELRAGEWVNGGIKSGIKHLVR
jgi:hypothetical protein